MMIVIISQYVYIEFVKLSKRKTAKDLVDKNQNIKKVQKNSLRNVNSKINNDFQIVSKTIRVNVI